MVDRCSLQRPGWIRVGLLRTMLILLAPITIAILTTPAVPVTTTTIDQENDEPAEAATPAGRARAPPGPAVAVTRRGPEPQHRPTQRERTTTALLSDRPRRVIAPQYPA
jgi:hypothetical protein